MGALGAAASVRASFHFGGQTWISAISLTSSPNPLWPGERDTVIVCICNAVTKRGHIRKLPARECLSHKTKQKILHWIKATKAHRRWRCRVRAKGAPGGFLVRKNRMQTTTKKPPPRGKTRVQRIARSEKWAVSVSRANTGGGSGLDTHTYPSVTKLHSWDHSVAWDGMCVCVCVGKIKPSVPGGTSCTRLIHVE